MAEVIRNNKEKTYDGKLQRSGKELIFNML